jgi:hypothetical protein
VTTRQIDGIKSWTPTLVSILALAGSGLLYFTRSEAAAQVATITARVVALETHRIDSDRRLDSIDRKLDDILDRLPRRRGE